MVLIQIRKANSISKTLNGRSGSQIQQYYKEKRGRVGRIGRVAEKIRQNLGREPQLKSRTENHEILF